VVTVWSFPVRLALASLALVLVACDGSSPDAAAGGASADRTDPTPTASSPTELPPVSPPSTRSGQPDGAAAAGGGAAACAGRLLARMDRQARAAQLVMIGVPADAGAVPEVAARAVTRLGIGGFILTGRTEVARADVRALTAALQRLASRSRPGIGLEISTDQEGGQVQALSGPGFSTMPTALVQGRLAPRELQRAARRWGRELADAGVTLDLAPVVDVVPAGTVNEPIGAYDRQFGSTPAAVAADGAAFVRGMRAGGVATSLKHFPGLGRASGNTDTSTGVVDDVTTRADPFLRPFTAGIRAGATYVMLSTATYTRIDPDSIAAFSPTVVDTMLRTRLGFRGVVISDDLGIARSVAEVPIGARAVRFVGAGGDVVLTVVPEQATRMVGALARRAAASARFGRLVDDAATRVLVRKVRAGLATCH
jgi:beta-N-acetylhexosaminidase